MIGAMCGVKLKIEGAMDLMQMFGLNEMIDHLTMQWSVHCYYVLRREDGHVLRRPLEFVVEGKWKKGRLNRTWNEDEKECVMVGLSG